MYFLQLVGKRYPLNAVRTFLSPPPPHTPLQHPHAALTAASIVKIVDEAITLAGFDGRGYTAKAFRPTWATVAVRAALTRTLFKMSNDVDF